MRIQGLLTSVLITTLALSMEAAQTLPGVGPAIQKVVDANEVSGVVTAVATKDKIIHLEATGLADIAKKRPMQTDMVFFLASTTKPFGAVAVLMLQDEGKLKLTDPVSKYIPEIGSLKTPSGKPANLTIAHLLTHTSGLAEHPREAYASTNLKDLTAKCIIAPMRFEPDQEWRYTTSGIDLAGRIVEIVSGKTFDEFLQERILGPLGMNSTTFYPSDEQLANWPTVYMRDTKSGELRDAGKPPVAQKRGKNAPHPGAGLYSTAGDLAIFCQMLLNHGVYGGKRYLSEEAYAQMTTVHTGDLATGFSKPQINKVLGWGYGVYVLRSPHEGVSAHLSRGTFGHPGALGTHILIDPVKERAYVFLVQRPNMTDNFENEPLRVFLDAAVAAIEQPST